VVHWTKLFKYSGKNRVLLSRGLLVRGEISGAAFPIAMMEIYEGLATFVWSRTLTNDDIPAALAKEMLKTSALPPAALLDELAGRGLQSVWIDGGQILQAFLAEGLVDIIRVTRVPIVIGRGIPLFGALPGDVHLKHLDTQSFNSGVVQSSYAVRKSA
jgi:dihydrofolate reductase